MDLKIAPVLGPGGDFLYYDLVFENGRFQTVDGIDEIKQRIIIGLSVYKGELFQDPDLGVDYYNNVFGKEADDPVLIDELKAAILRVPGVTGLNSFEVSRAPGSRTLGIKAAVKTTQGNINLATPLQG